MSIDESRRPFLATAEAEAGGIMIERIQLSVITELEFFMSKNDDEDLVTRWMQCLGKVVRRIDLSFSTVTHGDKINMS
ncbi:unnamed protein product [Peronospora belbahrii]|uniref:PH domain-containing protein n=1 Tax=Peronospora belbahrii TaxID=622444 RepID=A0ABN8DBP2_9STRA|nr:unnamed protein product [Peronospora belbahrii]